MSIEDCWQRMRMIRTLGLKKRCKEIIQAAEALTELTPSENITYITALDEYDYPDWFRLLIE